MLWIVALVGAVLGSMVGDEEGFVAGLLAGGVIGWLIDREKKRQQHLIDQRSAVLDGPRNDSARMIQLANTIDALSRRVGELERNVVDLRATLGQPATYAPVVSAPRAPLHVQHATQPAGDYPAIVGAVPAEAASGVPTQAAVDLPRSDAPLAKTPFEEAIRSFFFGGNTVVRIGILVLTIGVGLLVKYAADQDLFPLELRLAFAATIGLALVVIGYKVRGARATFGTALQGGGVAATYLVTFFAYYTYELLPGSLTMALLVAIAGLSSLLAVVQNSQQLAVFGAIGGFLSPVLASSGGGSHVALFSYYALLNAAISSMAVFRAWRVLNWVGFGCTFGIGSTWGALKYQPENMASASAFLALFFVLYVVNGTLFAMRPGGSSSSPAANAGEPADTTRDPLPASSGVRPRGAIDTTLTFGTPLAVLALAGGMFRLDHLYLALSCVSIAAVYFAFARFLLTRGGSELLALARAYIAIGISVATLAIPFALDDALATALAWATEASGLIWVGIEQRRLRSRVGGYLLFGASLCSLLAHEGLAGDGTRALFFTLIALAFGFAAVLLERHRALLREPERALGYLHFAIALVLWSAAVGSLLELVEPQELRDGGLFIAVAATCLLLDLLGTRLLYLPARWVAVMAWPIVSLLVLALLLQAVHPWESYRALGLALAIAASYFLLWRERALLGERAPLPEALHTTAAYTLALLSSTEAVYRSHVTFELASGWQQSAFLIGPLVLIGSALAGWPRWPVAAYPRAYLRWSAGPLALLAGLIAIVSELSSHGDPAPLPYLPMLNPLELTHALVFASILLLGRHESLRTSRTLLLTQRAALGFGFVMLNAMVVRSAHHWAGVPFEPFEIPSDPRVQSVFSILWTTLSLFAMVLAHRRRTRKLWIGGAVLLAVTVLKLFFVDLSQLHGVAKIVTFLAVGVLLLVIGYFAPVPPAAPTSKEPE